MLMQEIWEKVKTENARAKLAHGFWRDLSSLDHKDAIMEEVEEWEAAYYSGDIHGEHGEISEAIQAINVMVRRVMFLTGEKDA